MQANRSRDTGPEVAVRRALHAAGLRYRTSFLIATETLKVRADVAFTRRRLALFIDGCYWHGCPVHWRSPAKNADFWTAKIQHNQARDARVTSALEEAGWHVVRAWEHEDPSEVAAAVRLALSRL